MPYPLVGIPLLGMGIGRKSGKRLAERQLKTITPATQEHRYTVFTIGMLDAIDTREEEGLAVGRGHQPGMFDITAVSKVITTLSSVGGSIDAGEVQVKIAFELVTVGIPNLTITHRTSQLLANRLLQLPVTLINNLRRHNLHTLDVLTGHTVLLRRCPTRELHLLARLDAKILAFILQVQPLSIVVLHHGSRRTAPMRQGITDHEVFFFHLSRNPRSLLHESASVAVTLINID